MTLLTHAGSSFGHYKILSQIGAGGMGEVYLAHDTKLERKAAIKFLPAEFSGDPDRLARFIQEAQTASALNHPNIITVYEIGDRDGSHFIASEYIDGKTLRDRMSSERISFDEFLSVAIQTAEALSAAHKAGIVHRDIKPENVMLRPDGYVKVLDFGLAKLNNRNGLASSGDDETRKLIDTSPGVVLGTASYMSPEQARGKEIDARSDIFSFGVMMYEILAGHVPFRGETMMDVISAIMHDEPPPLLTAAPHLPKELQRIVHKSLKKKRDSRYHTVHDLLTDLKELRDELHIESRLERTAVPDRPERQDSISSGSKLTSSSGGMKDALLLTEFDNSTGESIFDQTLRMALSFSLAQSPFLEILSDDKVGQTLRRMGRPLNERVTRKLGEEICVRQNLKAFITGSISSFGSIYILTIEAVSRDGETVAREYEQVDSKEEVLNALGRRATALREKLGESLSSIKQFDLPSGHITTSSLDALKFFVMGRDQARSGKTHEAIPFYKKALELDPEFANAYIGLGAMYANIQQRKLAAETFSRAYDLRETVSEIEKLQTTFFYHIYVTGEIDKAIETLELWGKTDPLSPIPPGNLSDLLEKTGRSEKAVPVARETIRLSPSGTLGYLNLAESLLSLDRYSEVKETYRLAIEKGGDNEYFHQYLYSIAFIEGEEAAMAKNLKWFSGRSDEHMALDLETGSAAFCGKWRTAQDLSRRAIDLAGRSNAGEVAALYAAEQALRIVFWSDGSGMPRGNSDRLKTVLKTQTKKALDLGRNQDIAARAALALAAAGQSDEATVLINELHAEHPKDTLLNELWLPLARAAGLLYTGKAKEAIHELEPTERFEKAADFYPQYLRGLACMQMDKPRAAIREFDKILDHRGEAPLSSIYPLAQLAKARALKDKAEYEKFFEMWKDADADMPALVAAKAEYEPL